MEPTEPFYVGAMFPGGVESDYYFDDFNGFYRRRHDGNVIERWTGSGWMVSDLLTEAFGLGQEESVSSRLGGLNNSRRDTHGSGKVVGSAAPGISYPLYETPADPAAIPHESAGAPSGSDTIERTGRLGNDPIGAQRDAHA